MSTKTTIKRIALVAAVAAAFGGLSTVAANATAGQKISTTSGTSISTPAVGVNLTSNDVVGAYSTETITAGTADHVYTITSAGVGTLAIAPAPSAATDAPSDAFTAETHKQNYTVASPTSITWYAGTYPGAALWSTSAVLTFAANSTVAGTQTITVAGDVSGSVTHTITWGAAATVSAANSAAYISNNATVSGASGTNPQTVAALIPSASATILAAKTALTGVAASTNSVATVWVKVKDNSASGGQPENLTKVSATVTGAGLVDGYVSAGTSWIDSPAKSANAYTTSAGYAAFQVYPDGTAGTSSIALTYTDSNGNVITLGTVSAIFYGSTPAALKVTQNAFVGASGDIISANGINAETDALTGDGAVTVSATDSNGNPVAGLSTVGSAATATTGWTVTSDNTACVTSTLNSSNIVAGTGANALTDPVGTYEIDFNAASGAASGCVAHVTVGYYVSSTSPALTSTPVTLTIGQTTINSVTLTTDASSYAPGTKVKYYLTAKDSAGNPVADGYYGVIAATTPSSTAAIGGLSLNTNLPSTPWAVAASTTVGYSGIFFSNGVATASTYAPYYSGTVTGTLTLANSTSNTGIAAALEESALTASFAVASPTDAQASSATDAANEATDAANAATDAANAAADAADAATSAAQDAGAKADAALAAVTALSAKITVLAAQIAKIVKKLKA